MNNISGISGVIFVILLMNSCKKDKPALPVLITSDVTEISYTTAASGGELTKEGGAISSVKGVCWNTSEKPTIEDNKTIESGGLGSFTSLIENLAPNTNYYVRAYATNNTGTGYGNQVSFTTIQVATAILTTTEIMSITQTSAVSGGNITAENGGSVTEKGVSWGTDINPTITNSKTTDGTGPGGFISSITGLIGNTTYYVRAYATNSAGTSYGNLISFKTSATVPTVTTKTMSGVNSISPTSGGIITSDGGAEVITRGVCWSIAANPAISDSKTTDGTGMGSYSSNLIDLSVNKTYYVRAYATNNVGTGYGDIIFFTTSGSPITFNQQLTYATVNDIDGNIYKTIKIGNQTWMAENLKTTRLNTGDEIPLIIDNTEWNQLRTPGYCWYNNDEADFKATYGALYNWYAVNTGSLCPTGWHVPSDDDWNNLLTYLGGRRVVGGKLKETGTIHWLNPNIGATNESGFTALPGGIRFEGNFFDQIEFYSYWWSSTKLTWEKLDHTYMSSAEHIYIYVDENCVFLTDYAFWNGMSVRCLLGRIPGYYLY